MSGRFKWFLNCGLALIGGAIIATVDEDMSKELHSLTTWALWIIMNQSAIMKTQDEK